MLKIASFDAQKSGICSIALTQRLVVVANSDPLPPK